MFIGKTVEILLCNSMPNKEQSIKKTCLFLDFILIFIEKIGKAGGVQERNTITINL